jgi:hypothetical protein
MERWWITTENDIGITRRFPQREIMTAVECRDPNRPVTGHQVEAFHAKCEDTGIDKRDIWSQLSAISAWPSLVLYQRREFWTMSMAWSCTGVRVKTALRISLLAFLLGLVAMTIAYQTISSYRLVGASSAGVGASFPFFGVAVLALVIAIRRRSQPDAPLAPSRVRNLVTLLVLSGIWVFLVIFIWGL